MHPEVEYVIRQICEGQYVVKMRNGDIVTWIDRSLEKDEEQDYDEVDYMLAVAG